MPATKRRMLSDLLVGRRGGGRYDGMNPRYHKQIVRVYRRGIIDKVANIPDEGFLIDHYLVLVSVKQKLWAAFPSMACLYHLASPHTSSATS